MKNKLNALLNRQEQVIAPSVFVEQNDRLVLALSCNYGVRDSFNL